MNGLLKVTSSPHIRHADTTRGIMGDVITALAPAAIYGCLLYGLKAVILLASTVASAVAAEYLWNLIMHKKQTVGDLSAVVTGLLLGMNLPPTLPVWMAVIGSVAAIIIVKQMFGGLGNNFVNPAIAARIILLVSFPSAMTTFIAPVDAVSSATPLAQAAGEYSFKTLFLGMHAGCIGESSAFLLLIGGIYLIVRRVISPIIPLSFIGSVALLTVVSGGDLTLQLLGGGLMLGAFFMATDYVTSPSSALGRLIFGIGCGAITFVIRRFGSLPEGVSYSIILMNILTPHIERLTVAKPFGFVKKEGKHSAHR